MVADDSLYFHLLLNYFNMAIIGLMTEQKARTRSRCLQTYKGNMPNNKMAVILLYYINTKTHHIWGDLQLICRSKWRGKETANISQKRFHLMRCRMVLPRQKMWNPICVYCVLYYLLFSRTFIHIITNYILDSSFWIIFFASIYSMNL